MRLEQDSQTLNVEKQDLQTNVAKLTLNLQHQTDSVETLMNTISEYKMQNEELSRNIEQLTMGMEAVQNGDEMRSGDDMDEHEENGISDGGDDHTKMMRDIDRAFRKNQKSVIVDIVNALKVQLIKSNDELMRSQNERSDLQQRVKDSQSEHESTKLNNEAMKNMVETQQIRVKNLQRKYQDIKTANDRTKQLNEEMQIELNAKREFIRSLKAQHQKLESSNQDLLVINSDLRHELEIYDLTILNNDKAARSKTKSQSQSRKTSADSEFNEDIHHHLAVDPVMDRNSFDDTDEKEQNIPPLLLSRNTAPARKRRWSTNSAPTSVYEQNLDIIVHSVNEDEFEFMEDLSTERATLEPAPVRSDIVKRCHADAEKELYVSIWSVRLTPTAFIVSL